jgi:hypothetical protein
MYNQVQYLGCHLIKYNDEAARITRVYPIKFGINKNTTSWFTQGCGGWGFDDVTIIDFLGDPFWARDGELGMGVVTGIVGQRTLYGRGKVRGLTFCSVVLFRVNHVNQTC